MSNVFIDNLHRNFKIMMATLSSFPRMQTEQRHNGIFMFQHVYTEKVLDRVMMHEANPVATPCDRSSGESEDAVGSHLPYREAVGYLMCLMKEHVQTALAVSRVARAMDRPTEADWTDVKHILKYLRGTSNYGLLYWAGNSKATSCVPVTSVHALPCAWRRLAFLCPTWQRPASSKMASLRVRSLFLLENSALKFD